MSEFNIGTHVRVVNYQEDPDDHIRNGQVGVVIRVVKGAAFPYEVRLTDRDDYDLFEQAELELVPAEESPLSVGTITVSFGSVGFKVTDPSGFDYFLTDRQGASEVLFDLVQGFHPVKVVFE